MDIRSRLFGTSRRKSITIIAGAACAALVLGLILKWWLGSDNSATYDGATAVVARGPLELRINQSGELQAGESIRISPEIRGEVTIVELVDEGTSAKKGDIIARFDATQLEQQEASQEIEVENGAADLKKAVEDKSIQEITNEVSIARARLDVASARMEFDKYGIVALDSSSGFLDRKVYGLESESDADSEAQNDGVPPSIVTAALALESSDGFVPVLDLDSSDLAVLKSISPARIDSSSTSAAVPLGVDSSAPALNSTAPVVDSTAPALNSTAPASNSAAPRVDSTALAIDSTSALAALGIAPSIGSTGEAALESMGFIHINSSGEVVVESTGPAAGGPITFDKGDAYQSFRDAEVAILQAWTDLKRAREDFRGMDKMLERGFTTKNEYIKYQLAVVQADRRLESTKLAHAILRIYTYPKTRAQKTSDLKKAEDALRQAVHQANSQLAQQNAAITRAQAVYKTKKKNLDDMNDQLSKMTIKAPQDGLVIYGDDRRPWEKGEIKVGGKAYEGRTLITFPATNNMIAATKVQEKDVFKVKLGLPVTVTVPALPGAQFPGKVSKISNIAASGNRWMTSTEAKVFDVEVTLDQGDPRMKPGMSCNASILVDTVADCLYLPVNCVFKQDGKDVCCVITRGKVVRKPVTIGASSDTYVIIKDGLAVGTKVLMYNATSSEIDTSNAPGGKASIESTAPKVESTAAKLESTAPKVESTAAKIESTAAKASLDSTGAAASIESSTAAGGPSLESSAAKASLDSTGAAASIESSTAAGGPSLESSAAKALVESTAAAAPKASVDSEAPRRTRRRQAAQPPRQARGFEGGA